MSKQQFLAGLRIAAASPADDVAAAVVGAAPGPSRSERLARVLERVPDDRWPAALATLEEIAARAQSPDVALLRQFAGEGGA